MRRALLLALAAMLALPALAQAGYFPGQPVDGPSAEITRVAGVGLARDGGGAVAYEKLEGGANHVFASLLVFGNPLPPERVDRGQGAPSSEARIAVADTGRMLVAWINAGRLYAALRPSAAEPFADPVLIYEPAPGEQVREPSLGLTLHGVGYLTFTVARDDASDIRGAVLNDGSWNVYANPLDIDPARNASGSRVAASADGSAVAAWTEAGRVFVRRLARTRLSSFTAEASLGQFEGRTGFAADSPSIDVEDDSSYAWIAFRQDFDDGGSLQSRVVARRLLGDRFGDPLAADAQAFPAGEPAERPEVDVTGRGRGIVAAQLGGSLSMVAATMRDNDFIPSVPVGAAAAGTQPVAAMAENGRGTVAWRRDNGEVAGRYFTSTRWEPETVLSAPEFGAADSGAGFDASADTEGNQVVAFVQGGGAERRVVVAVYDKEPRAVGGANDLTWHRRPPRQLQWGSAPDHWTPEGVRFRVEVDGLPVLETSGRSWRPSRSLGDGAHAYTVVSIDSRGQETLGPEREFRVDTRGPRLAARASGRRRAYVRVHDGDPLAGSGVRSAVIQWGDGRRRVLNAPAIGEIEARHSYRRARTYRIRVVARDRAGNVRVSARRVRVRR